MKIVALNYRVNLTILTGLLLLLCLHVSCETKKKVNPVEVAKTENDPFISIVSKGMDFICPDTISSGWNTFYYDNRSNDTHFFLLDKYPEGKSIKDAEKEVGPVFQKGMDLINQGKAQEGFEAFNSLPAWFFEVVFVGGSGLLSPNKSSLTTLKLDPGYYLMECYVKMPNGTFHSSMGMTKALIVSDEKSEYMPPQAQVKIDISSTDGIVYTGTPDKGKQVISVYFKDQIAHENFVGHDLNLVKYNDGADLEVLESWLNWADPSGLISPAPEGFLFLGGVNDLPAGSTGYFETDLAPGNYALVSEVPNAIKKNLLKTFVIE